ncbi:DUF4192 family protein [Microbacterium sp. NPDC056234]|uniref:DUF4192 family protein n=1 Tax=Microbacterium sp. NPDC056234 TaxID=3345757 RepID=UPI0035DFF0C7
MTTVMKANGSAQFLGLVPALAGFTPTQSIVLTPFEGRRTYGALRMDLPDDDPNGFAERAVALVGRVERTDSIALVVYCDEAAQSTRDGLVLPHGVVVDAVIAAAEEQRLGIVDALCVMPDGWARYLDEEPRLHPLDTIRSAARPPEASDIRGDQSAGTALPNYGLMKTEKVGRALVALEQVICRTRMGQESEAERANPEAFAAAMLIENVPALFEAAVNLPDDPSPQICAALIWLLERPLYRDVALMQWAGDLRDGHDALASQLTHHRAGTLPPENSCRVMVGSGPRPDIPRLHAALRTARAVAALAPRRRRLGPLALAAWLSWAIGRPSHSEKYLEAVHDIDPGYSFGNLLSELIRTRPLPEWAFDRRVDDAA